MKKITLVCLIFSAISITAQYNKNVEGHQVQLGLPIPAILYEKGISKNSTLSLEATFGFLARGCTGCTTEFGVYPVLRGQYRYYYNMKRRLNKGKNISGNSGNYIGGLLLYQDGNTLLGDVNIISAAAVGPVYGLQRTYRQGFFYRLETGIAYFEDNIDSGITLVMAARIGWVLGHRRK